MGRRDRIKPGRAGGIYIRWAGHGMSCWVYGDRKMAQKVAAAPDMLAALEGAGCICEQSTLDEFGRHSDECRAVSAAIAKAKGEAQ